MNLFSLLGNKKPERPICVLHVDDSKWIRMPVSVLLRRHFGAKVVEADNGQDGILLSREFLPDLIILDVMMPQLDGFDTLAKIREYEKTKRIPVLMCTARDQMRDVNTALRLGALAYITKPVDEDVLVRKVREILISLGRWSGTKTISLTEPAPLPADILIPSDTRSTPKPSVVAMPAAARKCHQCKADLELITQYDAWYCHTCRRYPDYGS